MKCIYWNTKQITTIDYIIDIIEQENPDVFFLSEINVNTILSNTIALNKISFEHFPNPGCDRVIIIKNKKFSINLGRQSTYYSTVICPEQNIFLISVHLPSQMFQSFDGLKGFMRNFRAEIDQEIGSSITENILIIGDFNINPFEKPMIDFDGFAASNSINFRAKITHLSIEKTLYYNPTWQLYSRTYFPGSKHFNRPSGSAYDIIEHHYLDQVVLSHCLTKNIVTEKIDVVEKTAKFVFFDKLNYKIKISDHLPLTYDFNIK